MPFPIFKRFPLSAGLLMWAACGLMPRPALAQSPPAAPGPFDTVAVPPRIAAADDPSVDTPETGPVAGPPVVVTGARPDSGYQARRSDSALGLDLSRRETPQSISVVTRSQMDDFALTGVDALLDQVTGINVERVETDRSYYSARGFEVSNFQFDGVGMPFTNGSQWGDIDTALYQRIDVLRGANGLLSATGQPSATVNFVRKRPSSELQANAALTVGAWDQHRLEGDLSGALDAGGTVRARLVAVGEHKNSWLDRYGVDKKLLAGELEVDLDPATLLALGLADYHNDAKSPLWGALPTHYSNGQPTDYAVSTSTAADWAYWNNHEQRAHADLTHALGNDWELKATALQRRLGSDSELLYVYGAPDASTGLGLYSYPSAFVGSYIQTTADLRVSGPFTLAGRPHQLLVGLNYGHERARELSNYGEGIGTPLPDLVGWNGDYPKPPFDNGSDGSSFDTTRQSLYAAVHLNPLDWLKLIVGANATRIRSDGANYGVAHDYDRQGLSPYLGAVSELSDTLSAYASLTRIFQPQNQLDSNKQILQPIQGNNVEAGLKSEWLDKTLAGSLAVFRTRQDNTAEAAGYFPGTVDSYYRGVDATATGYEAELSGRPLPGWEINAGYTQLRLVGDDGTAVRTYVPRRTAKLSTSYQFRDSRWKVGAAVRAQSDISTTDGDALVRQGGYALLDLMARVRLDHGLDLAINLTNVTDRKYWNSLYWTQAYYGAPRGGSATLRWTY